jgi:hypothetical protein
LAGRQRIAPVPAASVNAFDDAQVAIRRIAQGSEGGLVGGTVVGSNRPGEAVELDQHGALIDPALINLGRGAAGEKAAAAGKDSRNGKLGVFVACRGIGDRAIQTTQYALAMVFPPTTVLRPLP